MLLVKSQGNLWRWINKTHQRGRAAPIGVVSYFVGGNVSKYNQPKENNIYQCWMQKQWCFRSIQFTYKYQTEKNSSVTEKKMSLFFCPWHEISPSYGTSVFHHSKKVKGSLWSTSFLGNNNSHQSET